MKEINLKTGMTTVARKQRFTLLPFVLFSGVFLIMAASWAFLFYQEKSIEKKITRLKTETISAGKIFFQPDFWELYDFETRLQLLETFLAEKSVPTEIVALLSQNTLTETVFSGLKMNFEKGNAVLECSVIVPNYSHLAEQVERYRMMERVSHIDFESGVVVETGVESLLKVYLKNNRAIATADKPIIPQDNVQ